MFKKLLIFSLGMILHYSANVSAQDVSWEAFAYDAENQTIEVITEDGMETFATLPSDFMPVDQFLAKGNHIAISPDRRYVVVAYNNILKILDLANPALCCAELEVEGVIVERFSLGAFNAQGTEIAIGLIGEITDQEVNPQTDSEVIPYPALLLTVDLASAQVTRRSSPYFRTGGQFNFPSRIYAWTDEGILFYPNCTACEFYSRSPRSLTLWNPDTDQFEDGFPYQNPRDGTQLAQTGETISARRNRDFPTQPEFTPWDSLDNVIEVEGAEASKQVVFFDPTDLTLPTPLWVADGQAFLHFTEREQRLTPNANDKTDIQIALVTYRDGHTQSFPVAGRVPYFLYVHNGYGDLRYAFGTPTGVVLVQEIDDVKHVIHYDLSGESIQPVRLGSLSEKFTLLDIPELGATVRGDFVQNIAAPAPIQCPGLPESNLEQAGQVVVTLEEPVHLYDSFLSENIIGEIPKETNLLIQDGPICSDNGAWWHVKFGELDGWVIQSGAAE